MIIDEQTTKEQSDALIAIESGQHGGLMWEICVAVARNSIEPLSAPITFKADREKRTSQFITEKRLPFSASLWNPSRNARSKNPQKARIFSRAGFARSVRIFAWPRELTAAILNPFSFEIDRYSKPGSC
jgi:hypothetical protein